MEGRMRRRYSHHMASFLRFLAVTCAASLLAGQLATAREAPDVGVPQTTSSQLVQLGAGDQILIDIFDMPDLRTTTAVAADGTIRLPLIGAVKVIGMSPAEAGNVVANAYRDGDILVEPNVSLTVVQSSSQRVSVMGEVRAQGRYALETNTTVLDLLALAGGITEKGSDTVHILRPSESGTTEMRVDTRNFATSIEAAKPQGGDTILVPKSVYIVNGEVTQKGEYPLKGDVDVFQAIARAGGVTPLGSSSRIVIRRKNAEGKYVEIDVNLKGKKNTPIQPDDVITVKERLF
jgi:polysaccharide export outer membrane protein